MGSSVVRELRESLAAIGNDYEDAWSLPGAFYTDHDWMAYEVRELFHKQWIPVGLEQEVAAPGDYFTYDACGEPVLVVRGEDGVLRCFANVCRHRGMQVASGRGKLRQFKCPYHHWGYRLDGQLKSAPRMQAHKSFDPATCSLPQIPLKAWCGFLFICLGQNPPDFEAPLAAAEALIRPYHLEQMQLRHLCEQTWNCNWKVLMENFMEGYHLSPLHRATLHKVNPTRLCKHLPAGDNHFGYQVGFSSRLPEERIGHADLDEKAMDTCIMLAVPPGLAIGIGSDYSSFLCLQPVSPARVRIKLGLIFHGDEWDQAVVDDAIRLFDETMAEDKAVLHSLQVNASSRFQAPGPLAPRDFEGTIFDLNRYLARQLA